MILRLLWNWALNSLILAVIMYVVPAIHFASTPDGRTYLRFLLLSGLILGILNSVVKPILKLISLPFILLTGGLFLIIINIIILYVITWLVPELIIPSIASYIIAAILLGILNTIENLFFV